MKTLFMTLIVVVAVSSSSLAATSINEPNKYGWGANIGWINWRDAGGGAQGAEIGEFVCSGHLWAANVGWIHLGDGTPTNGIQYSNASGTDYGVNHDGTGLLRGFAYGANIGWINFEATGNPRFDCTTGNFSGYAWSANCGWINLGDANFALKTDTVTMGADIDNDGISDAWERNEATNLTTLTATGDADGDGETDLAEYLADTDPLDALDAVRITSFLRALNGSQVTLTWTSQPTRRYRIEDTHDLLTSWATSIANIPPDAGATTTRMLSLAPNDPRHFFRVQAFRPLGP